MNCMDCGNDIDWCTCMHNPQPGPHSPPRLGKVPAPSAPEPRGEELERNRSSNAPGGMECMYCGSIFIGDESHEACAICDDMLLHDEPVSVAFLQQKRHELAATIARLQREAEGLRRERDEARRDAEGCVCKGNWRAILNETRHLIGYRFKDHKGKVFSFFGLVDGQDDYYYGMFGGKELRLLSCVGSIEGHGYTLTGDAALPHPDSETHGP